MGKFINNVVERYRGEEHFKNHHFPAGYDYSSGRGRISEYFSRRGFKVPMMYADFYARLNGHVSDRYLSVDLYYNYVLPCLNSLQFRHVYTDKNNFSLLMPSARWPQTVVKNRNGIFYDDGEHAISIESAIELCAEAGDVFIKPSLDTGGGAGVRHVKDESASDWRMIFGQYKADFIVQRRVKQSEEMCRCNATSLNTLRFFTYRDLAQRVVVLDHATCLRIGQPGSDVDNASSGGVFCHVNSDGTVEDALYRDRTFEKDSLSRRTGCGGFVIPSFDRAAKMVQQLHNVLAYYDFVAWDVAFDVRNDPLLIEYNLKQPEIELCQFSSGPIFDGVILDEVMDRVARMDRKKETYEIRTWSGAGKKKELLIGEK